MIRQWELNTLKIAKGKISSKSFPLWDAVPLCDDECLIYDSCTYEKEKRCKLRVIYLRTILSMALDALPKDKREDEYHLQLLGCSLIPLFSQLSLFKIVEYSVGMDPLILVKGGGVKMHPVYGEIRKTLKDIDDVWVKLGIGRRPKGIGDQLPISPKTGKGVEKGVDLIHGQGDYYDSMLENHESMFKTPNKEEEKKSRFKSYKHKKGKRRFKLE